MCVRLDGFCSLSCNGQTIIFFSLQQSHIPCSIRHALTVPALPICFELNVVDRCARIGPFSLFCFGPHRHFPISAFARLRILIRCTMNRRITTAHMLVLMDRGGHLTESLLEHFSLELVTGSCLHMHEGRWRHKEYQCTEERRFCARAASCQAWIM